ncbi:hypothetical protein A9G43_10010 [Gilliamella sp. Occ3-1]|nr:hypothetical protein [Gilliamella apicola]OCG69926.1 hypothetical protein A9G43_10010 [Gilliamella apicola]
MLKRGIAKKAPPSTKHCGSSQILLGEPPKITLPLKNVVYQFRTTKQKNEQISFTSNCDAMLNHFIGLLITILLGKPNHARHLAGSQHKAGLSKF